MLKPGGKALFSLMSLWGSIHQFLPGTLDVLPQDNFNIIKTGDLCPENFPGANHHCHLFRAEELVEFFSVECNA